MGVTIWVFTAWLGKIREALAHPCLAFLPQRLIRESKNLKVIRLYKFLICKVINKAFRVKSYDICRI
jgi:hypothetical protein